MSRLWTVSCSCVDVSTALRKIPDSTAVSKHILNRYCSLPK